MIDIAYLGPVGTYAESAGIAYLKWLAENQQKQGQLKPYPSIAQSIHALAENRVQLAVIPVENSVQGSVTMTHDTLWELEGLYIQHGLILPIRHQLLSFAEKVETITTVYSHPQALGQCRKWLENHLPSVTQVATNSTTEALQYLKDDPTAGAISSPRASELYHVPIVAQNINDHPDNCTKFWVVGLDKSSQGDYVSLAFSLPANVPGALVKPLGIFAEKNINLARIESRPMKRLLGEYVFFIDLEGNAKDQLVADALVELSQYTEVLKFLGCYKMLSIE